MDYIVKAKEQIEYWNNEENFSSGRERAEAEANCKIWKPIETLIRYYERCTANDMSAMFLSGLETAIELAVIEAINL